MSPPAAPAPQPVLPDVLLEDIFLRLDALADLARASAACTTFRRVISGRRFRSLRPAPVLGFLEFDAPGNFCPAEPPHRYSPAARGLAQFADFTFSFLPGGPIGWHVCDARDGRVLLYRSSFTAYFVDLVVCDPLHRRYVQLAPIHDCRRGSMGELAFEDFDTFLDPATERDKEEQDLPFRVICAEHYQRKLVTYRFSSVTRKWCRNTFSRSTPLDPTTARFCPWFERQYVHSCFYWVLLGIGMGSLDILDTHEMKFYVLDQLPGENAGPQALGIVETGGGRLGIVNAADDILEFYSKRWGNKNNGVDTEEWQHDKMVPLPLMDCYWRILSTVDLTATYSCER